MSVLSIKPSHHDSASQTLSSDTSTIPIPHRSPTSGRQHLLATSRRLLGITAHVPKLITLAVCATPVSVQICVGGPFVAGSDFAGEVGACAEDSVVVAFGGWVVVIEVAWTVGEGDWGVRWAVRHHFWGVFEGSRGVVVVGGWTVRHDFRCECWTVGSDFGSVCRAIWKWLGMIGRTVW